MALASIRPTYTQEQLEQYFNHIGIEKHSGIQSADVHTQLAFITSLIRHQLCKVPFENLDLHYSSVKGISLDPAFLFDKIVTRNAGRGGYCMQNNAFLANILRSLGFSVMTAGARVSLASDPNAKPGEVGEVAFGGYSHQVNIITLNDGKKYFVDTGFGSQGPTFPVPLQKDFTAINVGTKNDTAVTMRLCRGFAANNTHRSPNQELWLYCVKYGKADDTSKPWLQPYCFSETEFFPPDFDIMSAHVATSRTSMFVNNVICQKFVMSEDGEYLVGDITLNNDAIKQRTLGKNKDLMSIKNEEDRLLALEKYLGVKLRDDEKFGIAGYPTETKEQRGF